ncbi:MAG TPA: toll/interleukin-1 receptor domain-containing protein [Candidatus Limnocylindria bacterium]|nr:toll/interleukin-1 receptor domain-containing protein [Candidatus Limnocylindria bacterium]
MGEALERDHLFINYAIEDAALAEWLTLKLSGEGYSVWCDRVKLLGGESYPRDIERALHERTFRMLSLISRASKEKDNPLKERTIALNIGRARKQEFIIPLNVEALPSHELPWQLSDLTYIPFHTSWAHGLVQLLKKLTSVDAPRTFMPARDSVREYMHERERLSGRPERLWTNLLPITDIPGSVLRITLHEKLSPEIASSWTYWAENDYVVGAFEGPPEGVEVDKVEEIPWLENDDREQRTIARDIVTVLLKEGMRSHCVQKGLRESANEEYVYFPSGLVPGDRLRFTRWDGEKTHVKAVGERAARTTNGVERFRYHLAVEFRPALFRYGTPMIQLRNRVYLADLNGTPLQGVKLVRRRKRLCKDWWNYEWLSRQLGSCAFLADAQGEIVLTSRAQSRLAIRAIPLTVTAPDGINEEEAGPLPVENDEEELDETDVTPGVGDEELEETT